MNATSMTALGKVIQGALETRQTAAGIAAVVEREVVEPLRRQYAEAVATVAALEQKRVELERIANAERERVAAFERLRLGDPTALCSHRCGNPTHPVWLSPRTDRRGCSWCRLAEVERMQQPVGRTVFLADYDGAENGPKLFASLDAAKAWVDEWATGDSPWDWFEQDGVWEQWTCDQDTDRPTHRGAGTVTPLTVPSYPFPGQHVWRLWGEDGTDRGLHASEDDAKTASIAWYEEDEGFCPEYSWPRHEDGSRELVAGGERTGIYLTPAVVRGGKPGRVLPWVADLTDVGVSDLVSELASVLLDFYRPDGPTDAVLLAKVGEVLAVHRDQLARELAQEAAGAGERP